MTKKQKRVKKIRKITTPKIWLYYCLILLIILFIVTLELILPIIIFTLLLLAPLIYKIFNYLIEKYICDINKILQKIERIGPYEFEEYIASMFKSLGYKSVNVTKRSGDRGRDITMKCNEMKYVVQVKKHKEDNKVGRGDLQKLQGSAIDAKAQGLIFVTSGFFSSLALEYAKKHNIKTIDGNELVKYLRKIYRRKQHE